MDAGKGKRKRVVGIVAVILLVVLVLCTLASRAIYAMLLPVVETLKPGYGTLVDQIDLPATLVPAGAVEMRAGGAWQVVEVRAKQGDTVEKGDVLFTVDTAVLEAQAKQQEAGLQQLQTTLDTLWVEQVNSSAQLRQLEATLLQQQTVLNNAPLSEVDRQVLELQLASTQLQLQNARGSIGKSEANRQALELQLEAAQIQYDSLLAGIPAGGAVRAEAGGQLLDFALTPGERLDSHALVARVMPPNGGYALQWQLSAAAHEAYGDADQMLALVKTAGKLETTPLVVAQRQSLDSDTWQYTAAWEGEAPAAGSMVQVRMGNTLAAGALLLPLACLKTNAFGEDIVYILDTRQGLFSEEFVVKEQTVQLLGKNATHAALGADAALQDARVVQYTSKAIRAGTVVSPAGAGA